MISSNFIIFKFIYDILCNQIKLLINTKVSKINVLYKLNLLEIVLKNIFIYINFI